jgi:hypothetical protein
MTKVRVTNVFRDINTHEIYKVGAELEVDDARAKHLLALGLVELTEKPKPAKVEKPAEIEKPAEPEKPVETAEPAAAEAKAEVEVNNEEEHKAEDEQKPQAVVSERRRARKATK